MLIINEQTILFMLYNLVNVLQCHVSVTCYGRLIP